MKEQINIQKSLTQLLVVLWALMSITCTAIIAPSVEFTWKLSLPMACLLSSIGCTIVIGLLNMIPLMLGLGVLLYPNQWKKAEERSIKLQAPLYESYLVTLIRPFLFQMIFFIPTVLVIGYILERGDLGDVVYGGWQIFTGYIVTLILGAATRIGIEYFEQWRNKRTTKQ